jgi:hypothetical protein
MNALLFSMVDALTLREIAMVREQRAWDRRHYKSSLRSLYQEDIRDLRRMVGEWRSLWPLGGGL